MRALPMVLPGYGPGERSATPKDLLGPPTALRLRFPIGARVQVQDGTHDTWVRATFAAHWVRSRQWNAGEWAPYQLKFDEHTVMDNVLAYVKSDSHDAIRDAEPASQRRLVRFIRRPAYTADDVLVDA